ncbi:hypothetical protein [Marinobacter sp. ELB17]|uniref:DUF7281 domain-containing protein n=1 Tax=Marinobacter sp. ELB17 TaxID=270374 RepID=UPI0000F38351|nr:hypothetical protein [Marinobacter sp. ELB17]EAZ98132.1 hypothetical protein MELB17_09618 [Marinobacter sp. ELB17]
MSAAQFNAISKVVRGHKTDIAVSDVWAEIHEETSLGARIGKRLVFTTEDIDSLRQYAKYLTNLDPLFQDLSGNRVEVAAKTGNEKFGNELVFGRMVVMATLGNSSIPLQSGESARAPANVLMSTHLDRIDLDRLQSQKLLILENGTTIQHCEKLVLPESWCDVLVVYRGHGENVPHVDTLIRNQPSETLAFLGDFDPAGIDIATRHGKGVLLIPDLAVIASFDAAALAKISQREVFNRHHVSFRRLKARSTEASWQAMLSYMDQRQIAIMEEHTASKRLPLVVGPAIPPLQSENAINK